MPTDVSIMPLQASYYLGDEITLTASGADTYYWFDERSIDPVSEGNPYTFKLFKAELITYWEKIWRDAKIQLLCSLIWMIWQM